MSSRQIELLSAVVMTALILYGFYLTTQIDLTLSSDLETFTGPRAYPRIILGGMLLLALTSLLKAFIQYRTSDRDTAEAEPLHPRLTKVVIALFLLVVFASVLESLGYLFSLIPLMILFGYLNGARNLGRNILFSLVAAITCLVIFRYGLNTVLPEGLLGIDQIF